MAENDVIAQAPSENETKSKAKKDATKSSPKPKVAQKKSAPKTGADASAKKPASKKKTAEKKPELKTLEGFLTYRNRPMIRQDNIIYYGKKSEKYMIQYRIESEEPFGPLKIATSVVIELMTNSGAHSRLVRQARRENLYKAVDIGTFWLEDALENH
jgi:hypothetical protein